MFISILGTLWSIKIVDKGEDKRLDDCDAFTDKTTKEIGVADMQDDCNLGMPMEYLKKLIRHEVIHAFMFESGLAENWTHQEIGQEELTVDWIAIQFHKIQKVVEEVYSELETLTKKE